MGIKRLNTDKLKKEKTIKNILQELTGLKNRIKVLEKKQLKS